MIEMAIVSILLILLILILEYQISICETKIKNLEDEINKRNATGGEGVK